MDKLLSISVLTLLTGCMASTAEQTPQQLPIETINQPIEIETIQPISSMVEFDEANVVDAFSLSRDDLVANETALPTAIVVEHPTDDTVSPEAVSPPPSESNTTETVIETEQEVPEEITTPDAPVTVEKPQASSVTLKGYSIQLLALSDGHDFLTYLSQLPDDQPAWVNNKRVNGETMYSLLYGHYVDYQAAKAALAAMPQKIVQSGAFVYPFAKIKNTSEAQLERIR